MKVSVLMVTYNHEKYIRQAVESALVQETDFEYEIVIGEDCSTDGTPAAIQQLDREYSGRLRLLLRDSNLGMMRNFADTLASCTGEYVAFLEGDDYWTDRSKLQKQIDFLDAHPESSMCCHSVVCLYEDGSQPTYRCPENVKPISTLEDLLDGNFIQTCSVVFRRNLIPELPEWFFSLDLGDWPLCCLLAKSGSIAFLDEVMAVYRLHSSGVWSSKTAEDRYESVIRMYEALRANLGPEYFHRITRAITRAQVFLAARARQAGDDGLARQHIQKGLTYFFEMKQSDDQTARDVIDETARVAGQAGERGLFGELARTSDELAATKSSVFWRTREFLVTLPGFKQVARRMAERNGAK